MIGLLLGLMAGGCIAGSAALGDAIRRSGESRSSSSSGNAFSGNAFSGNSFTGGQNNQSVSFDEHSYRPLDTSHDVPRTNPLYRYNKHTGELEQV